MPASVDAMLTPVHPTGDDVRLARRSSSQLHHLDVSGEAVTITLLQGGQEEEIDLPAAAVRMLAMILDEMAQGHSVALTPVDREVSTQKAADILNVSRPHLVKLLEAGKLPFRKVGSHRRVRLADVMAYKLRLDAEAERAYAELVAQAQELGMGYD